MQDNMKHNNIHIIGIPKGEEEEQGIENLFANVSIEGPNQEELKEADFNTHHH